MQTLLSAYYHVDDEKESALFEKQDELDSIDVPGFDLTEMCG